MSSPEIKTVIFDHHRLERALRDFLVGEIGDHHFEMLATCHEPDGYGGYKVHGMVRKRELKTTA